MKFLKSIIICLVVAMGASTNATATPIAQSTSSILYVKPTAPGTGTCLSWDDACGLQDAFDIADSGNEIWVAAGTYKPTLGTDRAASFSMKSGVAIYGGFPPVGGTWNERDWASHLTTLSGDIGVPNNIGDNSYHVVTADQVDSTATLDGFTIRDGNAGNITPNGGGIFSQFSGPILKNIIFIRNSAASLGGGMYNLYSNPTLINTAFTGNSASGGGGMYNQNSNPTLINAIFTGNSALYGGGMRNDSSSPTLTDVVFSNNSATSVGGGVSNSFSNPTLNQVIFASNTAIGGGGMANSGDGYPNSTTQSSLTNVTFSGNTASNHGGGLYNFNAGSPSLTNVTFFNNTALIGGGIYNPTGNPKITNAIFWGNTPNQIQNSTYGTASLTYSIIQGGYAGIGNINLDPQLGPLADNGGFTQTHSLGAESPAIDAGDPATCPTTDQRGYHRPINGDGNMSKICDMGAYEFGSSAEGFTVTVEAAGNGSVTLNPEQIGYYFGDVVTLTATANPGWTFSGWGSAGTDNPLSVTIAGNTSLTAHFTQDEYILAVVVDPLDKGSVTIDPVKATYHYGDIVSLTANPVPDWAFTGWSGAATGTENPLVITFDRDMAFTAHFEQSLFRYILFPIYK